MLIIIICQPGKKKIKEHKGKDTLLLCKRVYFEELLLHYVTIEKDEFY